MTGSKGSILLIEDDKMLGSAIRNFLIRSRYHVVLKENGQEGLKEYRDRKYDLVLLDIMLPAINGYTVAKEIRNENCELPIVFITGRDMQEDKIKGFRIGADDYIIKPFNMEELILRIKAVIRRSGNQNYGTDHNVSFKIGPYTFDYTNHLLISSSDARKLTKRETELLHLLVKNMNKILRRDVALVKIWGRNDYFMGRSMDVYISRLRKMFLQDPGVTIENIHNTGFMLTVKI
ncbi:MAG: response regulator transcription factor [Bacteroidales bacterium]|nr:response regulator transcription factor [Bacteroidales bacterium]